jgi:hypothetical protein
MVDYIGRAPLPRYGCRWSGAPTRQRCTERAGEGDFSVLLNIFLLEPEPAQFGQKKNTQRKRYSKKKNW